MDKPLEDPILEAAAQIKCPKCKGKGMAWQYRTYGDLQFHGDYLESCDDCRGTGKIIAPDVGHIPEKNDDQT